MQITIDNVVGSGELWLEIMRIICGDTSGKSMVDLGCHKAPYTPLLGFQYRTYVDVQNRPLDHADEQKFFVQADAVDYLAHCGRRFDIAIASDFVEHLSKERGNSLIYFMQTRAKKAIIFTPLGDASVTQDGHPDSHNSGWVPDELLYFLTIVIPNFHSSINYGAFFAIDCSDEEKQRIYNEIKEKYA